ncbi:hypothetical protein L249_3291 [Ophiocordyceps polyrhachis-furcata BCC 54312]|uniref:Uncharacterized protein n=1 Tax=Ophiocordyceps polyrhachis-furcata BCC 54312 TaxID=1330021 RepID=A0A367LQN8_9HYPO|nr:hypothetical protein L249_3291 [Ophiocordyceps polyrhachis-furcata BCC 54312]
MATVISTTIIQESLKASTRLHNEYALDTAMPQVDLSSDGVSEVARIIIKFGYRNLMRLRLLHRHLDLPEGYILLEKSIPGGYWIEPTPVQKIDLGQTCGQIFSVYRGGLLPTEFRCGPSNLALDAKFSMELAKALLQNNLDAILGIEVVRDGKRCKMIETSDDSGSLLRDEATVTLTNRETLQGTAWAVTGDGVVDQAAEVRCVVLEGTHRRVTPKPMN